MLFWKTEGSQVSCPPPSSVIQSPGKSPSDTSACSLVRVTILGADSPPISPVGPVIAELRSARVPSREAADHRGTHPASAQPGKPRCIPVVGHCRPSSRAGTQAGCSPGMLFARHAVSPGMRSIGMLAKGRRVACKHNRLHQVFATERATAARNVSIPG